MNIFFDVKQNDPKYKLYLSQYKIATRDIPNMSESKNINEQMMLIISRFPYFEHTNAKLMAIAMSLLTRNEDSFNRSEATSLARQVFGNMINESDITGILVDISRYWTRLRSQS